MKVGQAAALLLVVAAVPFGVATDPRPAGNPAQQEFFSSYCLK
jgi:hypothetical protein